MCDEECCESTCEKLEVTITACCEGEPSYGSTAPSSSSMIYSSWNADKQGGRGQRDNSLYTQVSTSLGWETRREDRNCCEHCLYFLDEEICIYCPSLTWTQKLLACCVITALGFVISMGSFFKFTELVHGNPIPFVAQYSFGVLLSMFSSCILYGPVEQGKKMFHSTRIATIMLFFILMFLTVYLAFSSSMTSPLLMVALIIAQYLTLTWYSLSYVPWGRELVKDCLLPMCCNCITPEDWKECCDDDTAEDDNSIDPRARQDSSSLGPQWYRDIISTRYVSDDPSNNNSTGSFL